MTERCELVVIAEDNDTAQAGHRCDPGVVPILETRRTKRSTSCSRAGAATCAMLLLLDAMCAPGSEIHIMASVPLPIASVVVEPGLRLILCNISLIHHVDGTAIAVT